MIKAIDTYAFMVYDVYIRLKRGLEPLARKRLTMNKDAIVYEIYEIIGRLERVNDEGESELNKQSSLRVAIMQINCLVTSLAKAC